MTNNDESTVDYVAAGMHGKGQTTASAGEKYGPSDSG
jgi:hypothetical protein